jgi:pimeloyl-ACP methyl ester carboxylesterase
VQTGAVASSYRSARHAEQVRSWCRAALTRWGRPHETHDLDTTLGKTHVVSVGGGDRACLYLPGTNFNASTSTVVLDALAQRFRVHAADLPGQPGLSAAERPRDEVSRYAGWLAEVVAWVAREPGGTAPVVVGHSRGAAVALSADPDVVRGVALLSPAGLVDVRPNAAMLRATLPWLVRRDAGGARRLLQYMSGPGRSPAPELVEWMTLVAQACRTTGAPGTHQDTVVGRWRHRNVRVVAGEHDVFFPVDRLRTGSLARLGVAPVIVAGAGHLLVDEEPGRIVDLVATLL